jgi:hypothetical protein
LTNKNKIWEFGLTAIMYFRLVIDFIDSMLRESASRAVAKELPLSFREGNERWTEGIEKRAVFM